MEYFKLFQLSGIFVREEPMTDVIEGEKAFSFSLHIQKIKRYFYSRKIGERDAWVHAIRKAIGYSSFFNFYVIKAISSIYY